MPEKQKNQTVARLRKYKIGGEYYRNGNRYHRVTLVALSGDGKTAFVKQNDMKDYFPVEQLAVKANN